MLCVLKTKIIIIKRAEGKYLEVVVMFMAETVVLF